MRYNMGVCNQNFLLGCQGVSPGIWPPPGVAMRLFALAATVAGPESPSRAVSSSVASTSSAVTYSSCRESMMDHALVYITRLSSCSSTRWLWSLEANSEQNAHQWIVAVEQRLYEQRAAWLIKADGHIGTHTLAKNQHGLEVLQVECHIAGFQGVVPIVQKHLMCVH